MSQAAKNLTPVTETQGQLLTVSGDKLRPLPWGNIRKSRDPQAYADLRASIRVNGIYQSLVVRPSPSESGCYEVVAGYGRWSGGAEEGLTDFPCLVRELSDQEARVLQLDENIQREDLSWTESAAAAQQYMVEFGGDRDAAAAAMGWSKRQLSERLEINRLCDEAKTALDEGKINPGHVVYLAPMEAAFQAKVLSQVINEGWSVVELKKRVGKARRALALAKFDTQGCAGCSHNTEIMADLFGETDQSGSECSHLPCFLEKTQQWLTERKTQLEQEYGTVLLLSEAGDNPVALTKELVGPEQLAKGCAGCAKNATILVDTIGQEGEINTGMCIDAPCRTKQARQHQATLNAAKAKSAKQTGPKSDNPPSSTSQAKEQAQSEQPAPTTASLPKAVVEQGEALHRQAAAQLLGQCKEFRLGLMLLALTRLGGTHPEIKVGTADSLLSEALDSDSRELELQIGKAMQHLMQHSNNGTVDLDRTLRRLLPTQPEANATLTQHWQPTTERLKAYTLPGLVAILIEAGFDRSYDKAHGDGSFHKLAKKKGELIKAVVGFGGHDFSNFCPKHLLI